jgi:4,5:9,10-diseco-3-hydroxy-5,9,17-trioxoandrosta-1(10),2-diene-4-oate hydrolase
MIPEGKYADIGDGLRIHYHDLGEDRGGGTVVFLHGSGPGASGWSNFKHNAPVFAERGHRVLVMDNLGFGRSSKPDVDYGLDFVVGGMARALERIGASRYAVVGNSHGGACAIKLALDYPARVTRLVLMAPGGLEEREAYMGMSGIRTMMKVFFGPAGITRDTMRTVFELQLHDPSLLDDETLDERVAVAVEQPKRVMSSLGVPNLAPRLAELSCPVFGWWGTGDNFCPSTGATTLASKCADARVMLLSRCGHWVMVEYPALFNRLTLDFLAETLEPHTERPT